MSRYRVLTSAAARIDDIYDYTADTWGEDQARAYVEGLFDHFAKIAEKYIPWRTIPREYGVTGHFTRYRHHLVFFRILTDGEIGIAAILHEPMDVAGSLCGEFSED